jgi:hypothetical protein
MADINIILDAASVQAVNGKIGFVTLSPQDLGLTGLATSGDLNVLQNQIDNLDLTYASDLQLSQTGENLQSQIDSLGNTYVTRISGQFTNRPFVNGTGVLLSGEAARLPDTIVYTTGSQIISGSKTFYADNYIFSGANVIFVQNTGIVSGEWRFSNKPTVNNTGVLLEGDLDLSVYATVTNLATTGSTLASNLATTGSTLASNLATTGSTLQSSVDTLTTNLATTGSTLQSSVNTLTTDLATTGSTLASNLATTGSTLQSSVDTLTTNLATTGSTLASNLATTGSTLQSSVDTLTTNLATTGSTLASNLATTGSTLQSSVDVLTTNLTTTGSTLQSQITGKADLVHTHVASDITNSTNAGRTLLTSNLAAQRSHLDFFPTFPSQSFFPANGDVNRVYTALDTAKIYAWISLLNDYVEISPTQSGELDTRYALITNLATTGSTLQGQINNRVTNLGGASGMQVLTTGEYNSLTPISGVVYILT